MPRSRTARSSLVVGAFTLALAACAPDAPTSGDDQGVRFTTGGTAGGTPSSGGAGAASGGAGFGGNTPGAGAGGSGGVSASGGAPSTGGAAQGGAGSTAVGGGPSGGVAGQIAGGEGGTSAAGTSTSGGAAGSSVAGASSAGASGAGGGAGTANGGATGCGGLLCEDFESGQIDAGKWDLVAKTGTISVQQQRVAHGRYAAVVHGASGGSDDWALLVAKTAPAALRGTSTFGRMYFYWVSDASASIHIQMAFAGHTGSGSANGPAPFQKLRYQEVASYSGRWQLGFDLLDISPLVEEVSYSSGRLPTNAWACLEWQFEDNPDRVTAWVDGAQVSTFDNTNVDYASPGPIPPVGGALWDGKSSGLIGGFDSFGFGFHDWHPQRAFDVYYDDVVFDSKRIGCLSP